MQFTTRKAATEEGNLLKIYHAELNVPSNL